MTLREEITKSRNEMYADVDRASTAEDIELIVSRIDDLSELLNRLEVKLFNLQVHQQPASQIPTIPEEVLNDVVEVFKEVIAERKRELAQKSTKEV